MSKASPQVVEYLTRQLSRNPIHESAAIVSLRAKAFKLKTNAPSAAKSAAPEGQRQQVKVQLETIRNQCFTAPTEQLLKQLNQLPMADYPDLAALGNRLRIILESRGKLPALSSDKRFDGDFFSCLKKVLVSPSRDVSVLREQVLSSFRHRKNRHRGQAMVRLIQEELPELYALEADWLGSLLKYRAAKYGGLTATSAENSSSPAFIGFIAVVITAGLIGGIVASSNKSKSSNTKRQPAGATMPQLKSRHYVEPRNNSLRPSFTQEHSERIDQIRRDSTRRAEELRREHRERMEELRQRHAPARSIPEIPNNFPRPRTTPMSGDSPGGSEQPESWGSFRYEYNDDEWSFHWGSQEVRNGKTIEPRSDSVVAPSDKPTLPAQFE